MGAGESRPLERRRPSRRRGRYFFAMAGLVFRLLLLKLTFRLTPQARARLLSEFFETRGVLWIKLAQLLAMRRDLFTEEFCAALTELGDTGAPFPVSEVRRFIREDLGAEMDAL